MEESEVEIIEEKSKKPKAKSKPSGSKMKLIAVIIVVVIIIIAALWFFVLGGDDSDNGDNGDENQPPTAAFTYTPSEVYANATVSFDASGSSDPDGDDLEYTWDFDDPYADSGNPNTDSGVTASHIFTIPGDYNVTMVVEDGKGGIDELGKNITVLPEEFPTASVLVTRIPGAPANIEWTINIEEVDPVNADLSLGNIRYNIYNGTNTDEVKLTGTVLGLDGVDKEPPFNNPAGIYFDDNADSVLSAGDTFSIAGDGGVGIQSGDSFQLLYKPPNLSEGVPMFDPQALPS